MKSIKPFAAAFLLFCILVVGLHFFTAHHLPDYDLNYGTRIRTSKFSCTEGMKKMLADENAIPVFGSSEHRHGQDSKFHANTIFENKDMDPIFIGKAGCQCLQHAITLGAMGDELQGRKVVLIVSEQWFKKGGVKATAFGSSFSEDNYIEFLKNKNISDETKDYVIGRAKKLTKKNEGMYHNIINDSNWYTKDSNTLVEKMQADTHDFLVKEKARTKLVLIASIDKMRDGNRKNTTRRKNKLTPDDWKKLYAAAEKKGPKLVGDNPFGMFKDVKSNSFKKLISRGHIKKPTYTTKSKEFQDLECFLQVCKEEDAEPLIVIQPFNGYWYDSLKVDTSERQPLYDKVKKITEQYGAEYADLSVNEYAKYYFEDNSHLALKGLVDLNEQIYKFYREDKTE